MSYYLKRLDWWLMAAILVLVVLGVLFVYSASYEGENMPVSSDYKKQIVWAVLGICVFLAVALIDYHKLGTCSWLLYGGALILLVLVLVMGETTGGATRRLSLPGFKIQPSELAKLATLLALARFLSLPSTDPRRLYVVPVVAVITVVPFILIFIEPDLGTAAVLVPMTACLLFVAGVPLRILCFLVVLCLLLLPVGYLGLDEYQKDRVRVFLEVKQDPLDLGWTKRQSQIAVGSGGLTGKGYLAGTQNVLGFIPRNVAPNDFIYSVIAEETGFVGAALVLALYAAVLLCAFRAAMVSRDKLGRLLSVGVATIIFSHVFVNIAMTIGLMPITGLPLPLVSYGGSFMVVTMCGLGIVQSVYVRRARR
jgi:rod shape determining protein RodA